MKKRLLILTSISATALVALLLLRSTDAPKGDSIQEAEELASAVSLEATQPQAEIANSFAETMQRSNADSPLEPITPESLEEIASKKMTLSTADALIERELDKAKIAAEYSSSGDGVLSEADFRRHAEERYIKRRDLNGDGKVDGVELRSITQKSEFQVTDAAETAPTRTR